MSARWAGVETRAAATLAAETRWGSSLGKLAWTGTKWGGGILAFAPTLAIDAYKDLHWRADARGNHGLHQFLMDEATNQSGNAVGFVTTIGVTSAVAFFGGAALAASAPVVLVAFGAGLVAMVVFNKMGWNTTYGKEPMQGLLHKVGL